MTEDMHEERLQAVEAFGDSFVSLKLFILHIIFLNDTIIWFRVAAPAVQIYQMHYIIGGSNCWMVKDECAKELTDLVTKSSWRLDLLVHLASRVVSKWDAFLLEGFFLSVGRFSRSCTLKFCYCQTPPLFFLKKCLFVSCNELIGAKPMFWSFIDSRNVIPILIFASHSGV